MSRRTRQTPGQDGSRTKNNHKPPGGLPGKGQPTPRRNRAAETPRHQRYLLRLYVTGATPASESAIGQVHRICEEHLHGRYELEVFDIYQMTALAKDHRIVATPTLIKVLPPPLRRFVGNPSRLEGVLFGLDVREKPNG